MRLKPLSSTTPAKQRGPARGAALSIRLFRSIAGDGPSMQDAAARSRKRGPRWSTSSRVSEATMNRSRALSIFQEAKAAGPYDEYPVLPPDIDPQLHLSRNDRPQPFFLICEHDCVLTQMSGRATVLF